MSDAHIPVVVVGAGPVGLTVAGELAIHGLEVVVLERRATPDRLVKAGSIGPLAVHALRRRGLAAALDEAERRTLDRYQEMAREYGIPPEQIVPKEHFAGLEKVEHRNPSARRMRVEQPDLVNILLRHVAGVGVHVEWEHTLTGVVQDDHEVALTAATPHGDRCFRAQYVVGCDGGDSAVRRLAGIDFPGTAPTVTGRQGVVSLVDDEKLEHGFNYTPRGLVVWGLGVNRVATIEFDGPPDPEAGPFTTAELQQSLRRVSGTDVTITAMETGSRFTDLAHQAATYRLGRVFLAGDAAHLHAPFGGQGINTGVSDAANLGWKLAAQLQGWAAPTLLDSYHAERYPVGARLLANTRAQTALMRPDAHSTALRDLIDRMMDLVPVRQFVADVLAGTDEAYDFGIQHPWVGRLCPDLELTGPDRAVVNLSDLCTRGRGILLDLADRPAVRAVAAPWTRRLDVVTALACPDDVQALLIRPDGYIAWALTGQDEWNESALAQALRTWFGGPEQRP